MAASRQVLLVLSIPLVLAISNCRQRKADTATTKSDSASASNQHSFVALDRLPNDVKGLRTRSDFSNPQTIYCAPFEGQVDDRCHAYEVSRGEVIGRGTVAIRCVDIKGVALRCCNGYSAAGQMPVTTDAPCFSDSEVSDAAKANNGVVDQPNTVDNSIVFQASGSAVADSFVEFNFEVKGERAEYFIDTTPKDPNNPKDKELASNLEMTLYRLDGTKPKAVTASSDGSIDVMLKAAQYKVEVGLSKGSEFSGNYIIKVKKAPPIDPNQGQNTVPPLPGTIIIDKPGNVSSALPTSFSFYQFDTSGDAKEGIFNFRAVSADKDLNEKLVIKISSGPTAVGEGNNLRLTLKPGRYNLRVNAGGAPGVGGDFMVQVSKE